MIPHLQAKILRRVVALVNNYAEGPSQRVKVLFSVLSNTCSVYSRHPWGEISPPPKKKSYIPPKSYQVFFNLYLGLELSIVTKKLTIKLLFNFNNFNSRLPASSQHHIKYFNPQKAHPCVIPRILSHHASKSVKTFDLCTCL